MDYHQQLNILSSFQRLLSGFMLLYMCPNHHFSSLPVFDRRRELKCLITFDVVSFVLTLLLFLLFFHPLQPLGWFTIENQDESFPLLNLTDGFSLHCVSTAAIKSALLLLLSPH